MRQPRVIKSPKTVIVLRGDPVAGFKLYGPFESATEASYKAKPGDCFAHMNPPKRCPREDCKSVAEYVANVAMDGLSWVIVRGTLDEGFRFTGPFYEDDADDECGRALDTEFTATICEMQPACEL